MEGKKRIIFVDDEPQVLHGLRRSLFGMQDEWEMAFAQDGNEALLTLEREHFDVIVSDMRMPGLDGAELLSQVAEQYPHMVRIILSGQSNVDAIMKSVLPTHQFMTKPCGAETLKTVLRKAFTVRDLLANEDLKGVVSKLQSLPSFPGLYQEIMAEMRSPDFKMQRVGEIIAQDVGMTAKILQLVNSSFFGLPVQVTDAGHAARLLGADMLKTLVLSVQVFSQFDQLRSECLAIEPFSKHSLAVATLAREIATSKNAGRKVLEDTFVAGVLHDAGKLILAENLPEQFDAACRYAQENSQPLWQAEKAVIGSSHAEVGAYLVGLWGLPDGVIQALAFHHEPSKSTTKEFSALTAVHIANALVHGNGKLDCDLLDQNYVQELGVPSHLATWQESWAKMNENEVKDE